MWIADKIWTIVIGHGTIVARRLKAPGNIRRIARNVQLEVLPGAREEHDIRHPVSKNPRGRSVSQVILAASEWQIVGHCGRQILRDVVSARAIGQALVTDTFYSPAAICAVLRTDPAAAWGKTLCI